ncbi:MAG: shikimate kinase AroK [Gammaproteobacteria bacterium]|nr:shikimate kinase AroK [Gammaproteobacteria bacterium]NNK97774.1 shikimate kinase AroK [Xanthomonadales bacterium]
MSKVNQNIFLIGPMGSGKTSIGKHLARILGLDFYDCDHELERLTGASVNLIFDLEGEAGFRVRETNLLEQLTEKHKVLIATGGGTVCKAENRAMLRSRGFVVYLKTSVDNQLRRLSHDKSRPLLQAEDRAQRLLDLARVRNPLYEETADLVFRTRNSSVQSTAKMLARTILEQLDPLTPEDSHADC